MQNLVLSVVADNPIGESTSFPDSNKIGVRVPERSLVRLERVDDYDGEE